MWILGDDIRPDKENDIDILIDYYSDDLLEFMEQVFYNSLNLKPSLNEFSEALKKELIIIGK